MNNLHGYELRGRDGKLGTIEELYVHQETWQVRYLVVNIGNWLWPQQVWLSPHSIEYVDQEARTAVVPFSRGQIENSLGTHSKEISSCRHEKYSHNYHQSSPDGLPIPLAHADTSPYASEASVLPSRLSSDEALVAVPEIFSKIRSTNELTGYAIHVGNEIIGHVETFVVDTLYWIIRYVIVDIGNWLSGRRVLIAPMWISEICSAEAGMYLDLTKEQVETSPEYTPERYIYRDYETRLYEHYGQAPYWHKDVL